MRGCGGQGAGVQVGVVLHYRSVLYVLHLHWQIQDFTKGGGAQENNSRLFALLKTG